MEEIDDSEIIPLSMGHNFWTWSAQGRVNPIHIKRAKGVYFWDSLGKRYLDLNSMVMCVNIGHGDERVINAIIDQARELPFAGPQMATRPRALLGKLLTEITPGNLDHFLLHPGWVRRKRKCDQTGQSLYGTDENFGSIPFLSCATMGSMALTGDHDEFPGNRV